MVWRHDKDGDVAFADALFVGCVSEIGVDGSLPEALIFFSAGFPGGIFLGDTLDGTYRLRVGFQVMVPGGIMRLTPVGSDDGKGRRVLFVLDVQEGDGAR